MGLETCFLGAMDTKLFEALYCNEILVFHMGSHMSIVDVGWGSSTFHKIGREKVILMDSILPFGFKLLMCDIDMVLVEGDIHLNIYCIMSQFVSIKIMVHMLP